MSEPGAILSDEVDAILAKLDDDDRKFLEDAIRELVEVVMTMFDFLERAPSKIVSRA